MTAPNIKTLEGKVALITGASRGIGAAAAKRLAQAGASVVVNYHQNKEAALGVLREIESDGGRAMVVQADVKRSDQVEAMAGAAKEKFSAVDILVNNAYFPFQVGPLHELPWEKLTEAVEHELSAFHFCVKACLPGMVEKKAGKIIVISTRLAQQPLP
ncbi:MAG TPA: SDR family NAD(P)-dependent oxidoreductase, partial [Candidatus Binatia bacterium]